MVKWNTPDWIVAGICWI